VINHCANGQRFKCLIVTDKFTLAIDVDGRIPPVIEVLSRLVSAGRLGPPRPGPLLNRPLGDKCSH
jgi:hypothetical protein